jgi:hypothetical protein
MKIPIFKITMLLCFFSAVNLFGQKQCTPSKATTMTKASTATAKKKPAKKTPTAKPKPAKPTTNTDVQGVGLTPTNPLNVTVTASPPPPVNVTGGMPKMSFDKKHVDFGKIKTGDKPTVTYTFTNTGNAPLDIDIVSGCDCTELDYTRHTVQPGEKGFISAIFNSNKAEHDDHKKQLKKYIDIVLKQIHPQMGAPLNDSVTFDVFIVD